MSVYTIRAFWDAEAGVWVAESDDVPGLVAEAATPAALEAKLKVLVPELLELNRPSEAHGQAIEIRAHYEHDTRISVAA